jgi:tetratricopeptide (TPR) repeat protein
MADAQPKWSRGPGRSFADIRNGAGKRSLNPSHPKYREDSYAREMSDVAKDRETAFRANDAKERGNECLAEGNFRAAVQFYTTAINQHHAPEQHVYYSNRAAAYIRLQEWDEALADAERCVLVRPDWGKGYFRKGVALQGLRRLGEAVDAFRKGVVADPANEGLKKALEGATGAASAAAAEYEAAENDELHQAARKGDSGLIPSLLAEPGQDVNATNRDGQTPLHYAAWEGHVDCLQLLLDADADVNATNSSGQAPLHLAAWYGKDDAVEWLLARKADVNAQDAGGETALHHATRNSRLSTCRALLEAGCKALTKSSSGQMAFNIADDCCPLSTCKHDDIADLLDPWMEKEATAAEAAAAAESSVVGLAKIPKGTVVTVKGLQSATEHNGKQGQVEDYVEERGRFMVELDEGGVMLALKEVNLVVKTNKKKRGAKPAEGENTSVYVAGLPTAPGDCSENHLSTFFGRAGKVFKVKLYKQAGTGALKGDALVTYMSSDEADQSCALLNKQSIRSGYPISVKRADFSQSESKKKVRIKPEITKTFHGEGAALTYPSCSCGLHSSCVVSKIYSPIVAIQHTMFCLLPCWIDQGAWG